MTKTQLLRSVGEYFVEKGAFLDYKTYVADPNHPVQPRLVIRYFGAWSRLELKIRRFFPEIAAKIDNPPAKSVEVKPAAAKVAVKTTDDDN